METSLIALGISVLIMIVALILTVVFTPEKSKS